MADDMNMPGDDAMNDGMNDGMEDTEKKDGEEGMGGEGNAAE